MPCFGLTPRELDLGAATDVEIAIPKLAGRPMNPRRSQRVNIHGADPQDPQTPLVLLVDDDPVVHDVIAWVIQSTGYAPLTAGGSDGFRLLTEHADRIALVLLDLTMHDMDGFRFRELQLAQPRLAEVPTAIMSGRFVEDDERARLRAAHYAWK